LRGSSLRADWACDSAAGTPKSAPGREYGARTGWIE